MHERSLAAGLVEQIEHERQGRGLGTLAAVRIAIGEFAGVEPALLEIAFAETAAERWGHAVRLDLEIIPLMARCRDCDFEFRVERFQFLCPVCGTTAVEIVRGEELTLISLTAERTCRLENSPP